MSEKSKEESFVDKLKQLKDDLNKTAKKCKAPKPTPKPKKVQKRRVVTIRRISTKPIEKAVKKCKHISEIKKLMEKNDTILKTIKKQIAVAKRPHYHTMK